MFGDRGRISSNSFSVGNLMGELLGAEAGSGGNSRKGKGENLPKSISYPCTSRRHIESHLAFIVQQIMQKKEEGTESNF